MQSFMIESLRVSGIGKEDAVIQFTDGLNIICGRSNTGKTWILKCLYYLFSSDDRPFSPSTGYTDIKGAFKTERYGDVTISRKLDDNTALVVSDSPDIEDGEYSTNYNKKKRGTKYLNDLWLRIIGLDETIEVPKNENYARERISWTNIMGAFYVDEGEIAKPGSIILKEPTYATALVSSLIFLLTGDYKQGVKEIPKKAVAQARKESVLAFIEEQRGTLMSQRVSYIKQLEELSGADIEQEVDKLSSQIRDTQKEVDGLIEESQSVARQIADKQQEEASCRVLIERYQTLISQYKADLQRLDFISKGEEALHAIPKNSVCPFCGGAVHLDDRPSYTNAINAEIMRIASELAVIVATEADVSGEQEEILAAMGELRLRRAQINAELNESRKRVIGYQLDLQRYRDYAVLQSGIDFVDNQLKVLGKRKIAEEAKSTTASRYRAKAEFKELVGTDFDDSLNAILDACNYRSGGYVSWDFTNFNILIDGVSKSEDQGQGYCSFLNSVTAMMFYEYFNRDGVFIKPGLLMIDTPLLGFDEDERGFGGETIKAGLYQYFIEHQGDGQMIVVDNMGAMPDIDFTSKGVNVIAYHKDEKNGHIYGFMPSWRRDLPKENK